MRKIKLYEVNSEIQRLLDLLETEADPETGEISENTDEILERLHALDMERKRILEYVAKVTLNTRGEAAMLRDEEKRLKERRTALESKETRLMEILDRECGGEKTDLGIAVLSYRKSSRTEVEDAAKAIRWLKRHKYTDCYRVPEPEVAKAEVKKLINSGIKVPGCSVVQERSCTLK